jgi:hypothetical protein
MFPAGDTAPRTFHNAITGARRTVGEDLELGRAVGLSPAI